MDRKKEVSTEEKQRILLRTLMLFTLIKKARKKVSFYHEPLMLVLGNSVNTEDADLELLFRELVKVSSCQASADAFRLASDEIKKELSVLTYAFEDSKYSLVVEELTFQDVLSEVFNAGGCGRIEVIKIPGNMQELIFKHSVSDRPFMLLKIGDLSEWLRNKLRGYDIIEKFDAQSVFRNLNDPSHSSINILLGSRAFYEGWDSNRPNLILYLNIGNKDAKKFVLQSIGRGVRIEVAGNRKRLAYTNPELYEQNKRYADYLETLFVLGTKLSDIQTIIDTLKTQNKDKKRGGFSGLVYKKEEGSKKKKLEIGWGDYQLLKAYCEYVGPKILLVKHGFSVETVKLLFKSFEKPDEFYRFNGKDIKSIEIVLNRVLNWLNEVQESMERPFR